MLRLFRTCGEVDDPADAWEQATNKIFPFSVSLGGKGCPKGAFLGLCNAGLIKGVSALDHASASKNGQYAVRAVEILKRNRFLDSQKVAGVKYEIRGSITGPNGRTANVVSAWIIMTGEEAPSFVTAYPED